MIETTNHAELPIRETSVEMQIQELRLQIAALENQLANLIRLVTPAPPEDSL